MKTCRVLSCCFATTLICLASISNSFGNGPGGFTGGGSRGASGPHGQVGSHPGSAFRGPGHPFFGHDHRFFNQGHRFFDHDHRFAHEDFHHHHFFFGFDFAAFGFPYWWYPYYDYPYGYDYSDYSPIYDYRYWSGIATAVQNELAIRGFYHGPIDGVIGPGTSQAIRAFQKAEGLPVTGVIDPYLLKTLKLPAVPRIA